MYGNKAYDVYKSNSVTYASKEQLLLMIVDGAVSYAKSGRQAILDKDVKKAHHDLIRVQDIFSELMASLDLKQAGNWGKKLMSVYQYIKDRVMEANIKKDVEILDEVIPIIEDIRNTWYEAERKSKKS